MKEKKEYYIAKLIIREMPRTNESQERLLQWLINKVDELRNADPDDYSKIYTSRLMKK